MKKNVTIRIEGGIVEKAKEIGLNISKIAENALIEAIEALENLKKKSSSFQKVQQPSITNPKKFGDDRPGSAGRRPNPD